MAAERERKIRERAYHLWVESGHQEGMDEHHWHQATREVDAAPPVAAKAGRKAAKAGAEESPKPKKAVKEAAKAKEPKAKKADGKKAPDKPASPKGRKSSAAGSGLEAGRSGA